MTGVVTDSAALATLADIELPAPPEWRPLILFAIGLLVLIGMLTGLWFSLRRRGQTAGTPPTRPSLQAEALTRLAALRKAWETGIIDDREAGFRLGAMLRLGLGLPQLHATPPPGSADPLHWTQFVDELRQVRYRPDRRRLTPAHFDQARDWLCAAAAHQDAAGV
jgi:hypothetical protein